MKSLAIPRTSYFVASAGQPRVRRPRDFATAAFGLVLIAWALFRVDNLPAWDETLGELVKSGPPWVTSLLAFGYLLSLLYAVIVIGALVFGGPERRAALRDVLVVSVATTALVLVFTFLLYRAWPYVFPEIDLQSPVPRFPVMRVALVTGILVVVAPHTTRPMRRFGWVAVVTTAIASVALDYGSPSHTLGSFGIGLFCAGLMLAIVGSPRGYPDPSTVQTALANLGTPTTGLETAPYQTWGVVRFSAGVEDGRSIDVKVHGRDAFDSQLAAKAWHTLWYRETSRNVSHTRLQAVEHEALVTLMAERAGVGVPGLDSVGSASADLALIAFEHYGVSLSDMAPAQLLPELLTDVWAQVRRLHEHSMSHGALDVASVRVGPDGPMLTDFALGSLDADEGDQATDVVELLFTMSILVGADAAVAAAVGGLGRDRLVPAVPYLQLPALSPSSRRLTEKPKDVVAELTAKVLEVTGAEATEPIKLRRVTVRGLVMTGLLLLIVSALLPLFTSIDYAEIWGVIESANWALMIAALLVGQTQFFPQATATMFAVPAKLPFWPLLTLQTASQFISLAIPSAAGRVAMNAAFLHKFGVSVTVAVAQGAIDGFSGFLVQVVILVLAIVTGDADLNLDIDTADIPWLLILGIVALIAVSVVIIVVRVRRVRERIVPILQQAWGALRVVLRQPSRAIGLLTSNFIYWNILGLTLWLLLAAVGSELSYGSALFVAAGTSLLAGFMPIPGGVGVAEATMTALLATFGVDQSAAFAVTATYRVITFYLPALEGFFGTRWLERHDYI